MTDYLTITAAAAALGVRRQRVHALIQKGALSLVPDREKPITGESPALLRRADVEAWAAKPKRAGGRPRKTT